jgi:hypothetical protein
LLQILDRLCFRYGSIKELRTSWIVSINCGKSSSIPQFLPSGLQGGPPGGHSTQMRYRVARPGHLELRRQTEGRSVQLGLQHIGIGFQSDLLRWELDRRSGLRQPIPGLKPEALFPKPFHPRFQPPTARANAQRPAQHGGAGVGQFQAAIGADRPGVRLAGHLAACGRPAREIADQAAVEVEIVVQVDADLVAGAGVPSVRAGADGRGVVNLERVEQLPAEDEPARLGGDEARGLLAPDHVELFVGPQRRDAALVTDRVVHRVELVRLGGPAPGGPVAVRVPLHVVQWVGGGMTWWVVSDLNPAELREFADMAAKEAGTAHP